MLFFIIFEFVYFSRLNKISNGVSWRRTYRHVCDDDDVAEEKFFFHLFSSLRLRFLHTNSLARIIMRLSLTPTTTMATRATEEYPLLLLFFLGIYTRSNAKRQSKSNDCDWVQWVFEVEFASEWINNWVFDCAVRTRRRNMNTYIMLFFKFQTEKKDSRHIQFIWLSTWTRSRTATLNKIFHFQLLCARAQRHSFESMWHFFVQWTFPSLYTTMVTIYTLMPWIRFESRWTRRRQIISSRLLIALVRVANHTHTHTYTVTHKLPSCLRFND